MTPAQIGLDTDKLTAANVYSKLTQTERLFLVLPEISQYGTTSLTWPFNDAYKSQ